MNCKKPDRDEPRIECGYPLPCPYHTFVIDEVVKVPLLARPREVKRVKDIAKALKGRR